MEGQKIIETENLRKYSEHALNRTPIYVIINKKELYQIKEVMKNYTR